MGDFKLKMIKKITYNCLKKRLAEKKLKNNRDWVFVDV